MLVITPRLKDLNLPSTMFTAPNLLKKHPRYQLIDRRISSFHVEQKEQCQTAGVLMAERIRRKTHQLIVKLNNIQNKKLGTINAEDGAFKKQLASALEINRLQKMQKLGNTHQEFIRLSAQSKDYYDYTAKTTSNSPSKGCGHAENRIFVFVLKEAYSCFGTDLDEMTHRILRSLHLANTQDLGEMNWVMFQSFFRLLSGQATTMQHYEFLARYLLIDSKPCKSTIMSQVGLILNKLKSLVPRSTLDALHQGMEQRLQVILPKKDLTVKDLIAVMQENQFFVWREIVQMIML